MTAEFTTPTSRVLVEISAERTRQNVHWGEQNPPDGTGQPGDRGTADRQRERCAQAFEDGSGTWRHIIREEMAEAFAESDPARLRAELIQVAAVAVAWVEAIDRRGR